jgi:hypothetical protein
MRHRLIKTAALALVALALPAATASAADRDHDRMRDSWEKHYRLNTHKNDARKDRDRDGLRNIEEYRAGTSPRDRDTDDDGIRDDDEGAGTIKSFDQSTGTLVIDLFGSDRDLTGKVDSTTKIECEDEDEHVGTHRRDGADDNSGPGNAEDRGDDDDRGEDNRREDDEQERACDASALTVGRTVEEAELNEGDDGPAGVFDEIELVS